MNRIQAQRKWEPRELAQLRHLRKKNVSYGELATLFGRSNRAIASMVHKIDAVGFRRPWLARDIIQLKHMAAKGYSDHKIALTIGRTRTAVSQKRDRLRIPPGNPEQWFSGTGCGVAAWWLANGGGVGAGIAATGQW